MPETLSQALISDFRILRPRHAANHAESVSWLSSAHAKAEAVAQGEGFDGEAFRRSMERYVTRFGCSAESLAFRGHDLEDFLHQDWERMRLFNLDRNPRGAGMSARMEVFSEIADAKLEAFYPAPVASGGAEADGGVAAGKGAESAGAAPDELIHVTCTGYVAPSAAQKLVARRGWRSRTGVMHAYHMGCYASMPALRMASAFLASPRAAATPGRRVDIVHTETCTLHLDPSRHAPEQLVVQSLFSDGHIRYSLRRDEGGSGLRFLGVHEEIIPGSLGAMGWILGDTGMEMTLARDVPDLIAGALLDFLRRLFLRTGTDPAEAFSKGVFAVHPGGPRIIDKVADLLELRPAQVAASRAVLKAFGNMSSATLPHVWSALLADAAVPAGTLITSLAFGPGLTVYGAMLRKA